MLNFKPPSAIAVGGFFIFKTQPVQLLNVHRAVRNQGTGRNFFDAIGELVIAVNGWESRATLF
ncbi:MAG: hypothetical protein WDN00_06015 [Limisphaerales bacterium]